MNVNRGRGHSERSWGDEVERTRLELSDKLGEAERTLLPLAAGALGVVFGLQLLAIAGVLILGRVMPAWLAAVILGGSSVLLGVLVMTLAARRALEARRRRSSGSPGGSRDDSRAA